MTVHRNSLHAQPVAHDTSRGAAIAILISAVASIIAVAMDSMAGGKDAVSIMQSMVQLQQSHLTVHMVAMASLCGFMYGYTVLSQRLGLRRGPVLAGLLAYAFGTMLMLIAATIDGLISTDLAAMFVTKAPEVAKTGYWIIQSAAGVALIDIARVSWVLQSVAALCWSVALLGTGGYARKAGMFGVLISWLPAAAVMTMGSSMTEMTVVAILLLQAVFNLTIVTVLFKRDNGLAAAADIHAMPQAMAA
jgi:hypothetical protein